MKIALVYTGAGIVPALTQIASDMYPNCEIMNLLDDTLIKDCMKAGEMTKDVKCRLIDIFQYAYHAGADMILLTCSSVGEAAYTGNELLPIPILRIDQPMAEKAVKEFSRIGVIAALSTTLDPTCDLVKKEAEKQGKNVEVVHGLAKGAYEANVSGNPDLHDELILKTAIELSDKCDVFLLAQASMARMERKLSEATGKMVLSSPQLGIAQLEKYIQ